MNKEQLAEYNKDRKIKQICYVTYDYKETIKYLCESLNIGPWTIIAHSDQVTKEIKFKGKSVDTPFKFICAFAFMGEMQIEVIEPVSGENPYSKFLEEKGPGIHHIKECICDNDRLLKTISEYEKNGIEVIYQGKYKEDLFFYLDTMEELGGLYEIGNCPLIEDHPTLMGYYPEK
jgi:methylmalonyl-CoA/ethylmalonyl-CoA epimerase